ncbi:hypothetical protein FGO68_gene8346 [Halteria grandinella]|uniref:Uncharacterized protein n=1 Tax=Halteria grandinella TaxID=5974 RepID=A0A8J8T686_HALGN|nr:hypothetical protein FGO68_gene8346 [Halteria grandinella]
METEEQLLSIYYEQTPKSTNTHYKRRKKTNSDQRNGVFSLTQIQPAGQYRFGKIKSKYLIIEAISYSGHRREVLQLLSQSSKALKMLAISNFPILLANLITSKFIISTSSELLRMLLKKVPDSTKYKFNVSLQRFMQSKMLDYLLMLGRYAPHGLSNLHKIAFKFYGLNIGETGQEPLISFENEILIKLREVIQKCKNLNTLQYPKYRLDIVRELVSKGNIKHLKFNKDQWWTLTPNWVSQALQESPNKSAFDQLYNLKEVDSDIKKRKPRRGGMIPGVGRGQPNQEEFDTQKRQSRLHTLQELYKAFKEQPEETYIEVEKLTIAYSLGIEDIGYLLRLVRPIKKLKVVFIANGNYIGKRDDDDSIGLLKVFQMIERLQMPPFNLIQEGFELRLRSASIEDLMLFDKCKIKNKQLLRLEQEFYPMNREEAITLCKLYFKHLKKKPSQNDLLKPHKVKFQIDSLMNDLFLPNFNHLPAKNINMLEHIEGIDTYLCELENWDFRDKHTQALTIKQNIFLALPYIKAAIRCMPNLKQVGIIHEEIIRDRWSKKAKEDQQQANRYKEAITSMAPILLQNTSEILKKSNINEVKFIYHQPNIFEKEYNQQTLALNEQLAKQSISTLSSLNHLTKITLGGFPCQSMLSLLQAIENPKYITHLNLLFPQQSFQNLIGLELDGVLKHNSGKIYEGMVDNEDRDQGEVKKEEVQGLRTSMIIGIISTILNFENLEKLELLIFNNELKLATELMKKLNRFDKLTFHLFVKESDKDDEEDLCTEFIEAISKLTVLRQLTVQTASIQFKENIPKILMNKRPGFILKIKGIRFTLTEYLDLLHLNGNQHTINVEFSDYDFDQFTSQRQRFKYTPEDLESMTGRQRRYLHYDTHTRHYTRERHNHHNQDLQLIKKHMKRTFNK